jgi:hypothetical protein
MPPPDSDTSRGRLDIAFRRRKPVDAYVRDTSSKVGSR